MKVSEIAHYRPLDLAEDQAQQLRSGVSLQLWYGAHGRMADASSQAAADRTHILGLRDDDFAMIQSYVETLDPAHGDVLSSEATRKAGFASPWQASDFLQLLQGTLTEARQFMGSDYPGETFDMTQPGNLLAALEIGRRYQVITPLEYAQGLALAGNIPVYYADKTAADIEQRNHHYERIFENVTYLRNPIFAVKAGRQGVEHLKTFQDRRTIEQFGKIALAMRPPQGEKPILAHVSGFGHVDNMSTLLSSVDIPFEAKSFSPDALVRKRRRSLRDYGHRILGVYIRSVDDYLSAEWQANAATWRRG